MQRAVSERLIRWDGRKYSWEGVALEGRKSRLETGEQGPGRANETPEMPDSQIGLLIYLFSSFAAVREFIKKLIASERLLLPALEVKKMAAPSNGG